MNNFNYRKAVINDVDFITKAIMEAEKSNTDKLSYSTLFNLSNAAVKELIKLMLLEEIDGCEFSISSFYLVENNNEKIAAFAGWIENIKNSKPSKILKANLINYTFGKKNTETLIRNAPIVSELIIEREPLSLQFEFLYVESNFRGKNIPSKLIEFIIDQNKSLELKKAQVQVFANNIAAIKIYTKNGFIVSKVFKSDNENTLKYLPFNQKYLMEKKMNYNG